MVVKKFLFILLFLPASVHATLTTKDIYTASVNNVVVVRIFMEYDDVTLQLSTSPIHCVNNSNQNASFKFTTFGTATNGEDVFPSNTTGTGLFNGSVGAIQITNLSKNDFDKLNGYCVWPR